MLGKDEVDPQEYLRAVTGEDPPVWPSLAYDWVDKPHRLVYDLVGEVERLRKKNAELGETVREVAGKLRRRESGYET